jgi:hypothetical protein
MSAPRPRFQFRHRLVVAPRGAAIVAGGSTATEDAASLPRLQQAALAVLIRSVASRSLATPHNGGVVYRSSVPRIPAAAIMFRAVLFTNEENGLCGGKAYAAAHAHERQVAALETDLGGGRSHRWGAAGSQAQFEFFARAAAPLGLPIGPGSGADISPLGDHGVLLIGPYPEDGPYFEVHHTHADTFEKIESGDVRTGLAAVAGLLWQPANEPLEAP